jgi:hypothetical protein
MTYHYKISFLKDLFYFGYALLTLITPFFDKPETGLDCTSTYFIHQGKLFSSKKAISPGLCIGKAL